MIRIFLLLEKFFLMAFVFQLMLLCVSLLFLLEGHPVDKPRLQCWRVLRRIQSDSCVPGRGWQHRQLTEIGLESSHKWGSSISLVGSQLTEELVCEQGSKCSSKIKNIDGGPRWSQDEDQEPCGFVDLAEVIQEDRTIEADKCKDGVKQEITSGHL